VKQEPPGWLVLALEFIRALKNGDTRFLSQSSPQVSTKKYFTFAFVNKNMTMTLSNHNDGTSKTKPSTAMFGWSTKN